MKGFEMQKRTWFVALMLIVLGISGIVPVAAQDDVTVVRWFVGLGAGGQPEQIAAQEAIVEAFNASQSEIRLEIEIVDNNVAYNTLGTLIATGNSPDIVGPVGTDGSNAFTGNFLDLTPYIEASGYDISQYDEAAVEAYRTEEGLIGLPFATFPSFIYYRPSLFDEAGLNYPPSEYGAPYVWDDGTEAEWNFETLREVALILTVDSNGYDATEDEFDSSSIEQWGFVSQWNEPRGHASLFGAANPIDEDGNAVIPQAWTDAFNWFYSGIWEDNFIPNAAQAGSDLLAQGNAFSSGRVALAHSHLWYTCCLGEFTEDWDIAPVPTHNGVATAKLHGDTFRILKGTQNPEAAFTVLAYLLSEEATPELLRAYGGMPAREAEQDSFFASLDETYPQGVNWQVAIDSLGYADSPNHETYLPNYSRTRDRFQAFQTLYEGTPGLDIDAELEVLRADLQALYDTAGEIVLPTLEDLEEEAEAEAGE
jgi:multiple sugar transport system substrate-binding protein